MTPKERLFARMRGECVDRIPNLNIVMQFVSQYTGIPYDRVSSDYRCLVEAHSRVARDFSIDILSTMSDPYRETADFGARVRFPGDALPLRESVLMREASDWRKLRRWDPLESVRTLDRIRAVERFKREWGDEYPILGWVEAPWAEICDLADITEAMYMLVDEPEEIALALDFVADQEAACALAQIDAGADVIGMGDAAASLVSPETYRSLFLPAEKRVVDAAHGRGAAVKLHICGNVTRILPWMLETGADIIDVDSMVDYPEAIRLAGDRASVCGNLNPVELLLNGRPEEIRRETLLLAEQSGARGMISGGCEAPRATPGENLLAVAEGIGEYARRAAR